MNSTFYKLLDNTIDEVHRREPAYTSSFPLAVATDEMASEYWQHPLCEKFPSGTIEQALDEGLSYLGKVWTKAEQPSSKDPMAQVLCDCIMDAFCADQGLLALQPHNGHKHSMVELLEQHYSKRQATGGVTYYVRDGGSRPLLLINATGAPIAIWNKFFADTSHNFKIILPHRRGSDLFQGGLQQHVDIRQDSVDLGAILDAESMAQCNVLAWCNGARVAIDLANYNPARISSMVLLGPMIKGVRGVPPLPSNFERDLQPLLDTVSKESSLAPFVAKVIAKRPVAPDWKRWVNAPECRAQALFAMPAREHAGAITAMLTEAQSFINIARRVASDESYPMDQALGKLQTRTMVIMGSDDNVVSNELFSLATEKMCRNPISKVVLKGSGHYVQDLQYHYFRWLLNEFFEKHQSPPMTARVWVEDLPRSA